MAARKRVFIVEDHKILREGLRALLCLQPDLEIVGEAGDGRDAVRQIAKLLPDLVLMDLSMPGISGIDAIRELKRFEPSLRIIVLTVHRTEEYVLASLRAGASGYVLKDASHAELTTAIRSVLAGKTYLSVDIQEKVVAVLAKGPVKTDILSPWEALTPRERQILKLIAETRTNKEIADYLSISMKTVEKHRANLMRKLNLHSASAVTAFAFANGLLEH